MCCFLAVLAFLGPRAALAIWWLVDQNWFSKVYDTFIWPFLGFLIMPWTTLMYVLVYPAGINGFDYVWLVIAIAMDVFTWTGGGVSGRNRSMTTTA